MVNFLQMIISNLAFDAAFLSWFIAQVIKMIIILITDGKFNFKRFMASGGMPSSHSSFVVALFFMVVFIDGIQSTQCAIAAGLACIVMYDAAGVRRAVGEQARAINKIHELWENPGKELNNEELKEILGHTPIQVLAGAILGLIIAIIFYFAFLR